MESSAPLGAPTINDDSSDDEVMLTQRESHLLTALIDVRDTVVDVIQHNYESVSGKPLQEILLRQYFIDRSKFYVNELISRKPTVHDGESSDDEEVLSKKESHLLSAVEKSRNDVVAAILNQYQKPRGRSAKIEDVESLFRKQPTLVAKSLFPAHRQRANSTSTIRSFSTQSNENSFTFQSSSKDETISSNSKASLQNPTIDSTTTIDDTIIGMSTLGLSAKSASSWPKSQFSFAAGVVKPYPHGEMDTTCLDEGDESEMGDDEVEHSTPTPMREDWGNLEVMEFDGQKLVPVEGVEPIKVPLSRPLPTSSKKDSRAESDSSHSDYCTPVGSGDEDNESERSTIVTHGSKVNEQSMDEDVEKKSSGGSAESEEVPGEELDVEEELAREQQKKEAMQQRLSAIETRLIKKLVKVVPPTIRYLVPDIVHATVMADGEKKAVAVKDIFGVECTFPEMEALVVKAMSSVKELVKLFTVENVRGVNTIRLRKSTVRHFSSDSDNSIIVSPETERVKLRKEAEAEKIRDETYKKQKEEEKKMKDEERREEETNDLRPELPHSLTLPLIPIGCENAIDGTQNFQSVFEARYCQNDRSHLMPRFFVGSLADAMKKAFECPEIADRKPLAIYLHHDKAIGNHIFANTVLCNEAVIDQLKQFVLWPWDLTDKENELKAIDWFEENGLVEVSRLVRLSLGDVDNFPLLFFLWKEKGMVDIVGMSNGVDTANEVMERLLQTVEAFERAKRVKALEERSKAEGRRDDREGAGGDGPPHITTSAAHTRVIATVTPLGSRAGMDYAIALPKREEEKLPRIVQIAEIDAYDMPQALVVYSAKEQADLNEAIDEWMTTGERLPVEGRVKKGLPVLVEDDSNSFFRAVIKGRGEEEGDICLLFVDSELPPLIPEQKRIQAVDVPTDRCYLMPVSIAALPTPLIHASLAINSIMGESKFSKNVYCACDDWLSTIGSGEMEVELLSKKDNGWYEVDLVHARLGSLVDYIIGQEWAT